ncbi:SDR family oxidoreductase [Marinactinospora thermotolerans]|uniref:3-oxoacyl-[acyl-carrier protein] reductase n=1 Tax=Marinactinospora thermotolerans DSM 45154 TaxID=1122192 RepID=A0A1T4T9Y7_9ACTN|nr:SDR family oxidoreductase [Marinactinospora thermotolerans]SKA37325.1 3-oxoacyl-[acyl-carrier protein] reductase [Marinactinospora thermotolerans DSM 45154]
MDIGLAGRTALVPGASSGLGLAIARALAAEGANVVMAARRGDLLRRHAAELPSALAVEIDITAPDAARRLVGAAVERFGQVDVCVLNGGGPAPGTALEATDADLLRAVETQLLTHQRLAAAVLPGMRERGWGRLVAVGSAFVQEPAPNMVGSNTGRAALAAYLKTLAAEVAADGVTVNMVLPGRIDTDRVAHLDREAARRSGRTPEQVRADSVARIPVGRLGTPEEFAAVVTFLAGAPASYVTGSQIRCDGGLLRAL